ncbi:hypothetical protein [Magnetospirillum sp. ME-1]|uniref:hypothetical protein n=1 Tax=Magnetospirillum sp. ME-1 TaxID=1639348 RepID=UPI0011AE9B11|nr:hypothetical protein [Magnetospirillum sp. ME-1]
MEERPSPIAPPIPFPLLAVRMAERLPGIPWTIVLRRDFADLGSYARVGRGIQRLVHDGLLIRLGQGIYTKTCIGPVTKRIIPPDDLVSLTREAMERLGIGVGMNYWEKKYFARETDQVPLGFVVATMRPVRRKLSWGGHTITFVLDGE